MAYSLESFFCSASISASRLSISVLSGEGIQSELQEADQSDGPAEAEKGKENPKDAEVHPEGRQINLHLTSFIEMFKDDLGQVLVEDEVEG